MDFKNALGKVLFWVIWPGLWLYMPLTRRVRVLIVHGDNVLLVRHWLGTQKWELPGGGIAFNESVEVAAKREIAEELDLALHDIEQLSEGFLVHTEAGILKRQHYVLAQVDAVETTMNISREIIEAQWRPFTEVEELVPAGVFQAVQQRK